MTQAVGPPANIFDVEEAADKGGGAVGPPADMAARLRRAANPAGSSATRRQPKASGNLGSGPATRRIRV